jgi:hypothetical protein
MTHPGNDPIGDDRGDEDRAEDRPARRNEPPELSYSQIATAGVWFIFVPVIAAGLSMMFLGLTMLSGEGVVPSLIVGGFGAFLTWAGVRLLRKGIANHRPVAETYADADEEDDDEEDDDEEPGNEYWRVPGYDTDEQSRPRKD